MEHGHPWRTEALDIQRSRQRRFLSQLPSDVYRVFRLPSVSPGGGSSGTDGQLETMLRYRAEVLLYELQEDRQVTALLEHTEYERLSDLVWHRVDKTRDPLCPQGDMALERLRQQHAAPKPSPEGLDDKLADYFEFMLLAGLADVLANDDYADPRFGQRPPSA